MEEKSEVRFKVCPVMNCEGCRETRCAWFDDCIDECALVSIAQAVTALAFCVNIGRGTFDVSK